MGSDTRDRCITSNHGINHELEFNFYPKHKLSNRNVFNCLQISRVRSRFISYSSVFIPGHFNLIRLNFSKNNPKSRKKFLRQNVEFGGTHLLVNLKWHFFFFFVMVFSIEISRNFTFGAWPWKFFLCFKKTKLTVPEIRKYPFCPIFGLLFFRKLKNG